MGHEINRVMEYFIVFNVITFIVSIAGILITSIAKVVTVDRGPSKINKQKFMLKKICPQIIICSVK